MVSRTTTWRGALNGSSFSSAKARRSSANEALASGAHRGEIPWPRRLRIHKIADAYSLTWSFAHPDGRALFIIERGSDGAPVLTWIAIGYDIYD